MNTKVKILASALLGVSALLGGFGTASAASKPGEIDPVLPPSTMTASGKTFYVQSAAEATGGGGRVVCGPYDKDPSATVFLCLNVDTQIGFAGRLNTGEHKAQAYHIEEGTRVESGVNDLASDYLVESRGKEISSLKTQRNALAALSVVLLLIIAAMFYFLRGLHKKNAILEKKAKAYDQLQDLAEGLKTHYPLSSGE